MELVYLWVEEYKNIKKQGFNFSPTFRCEYDEATNKLTVEKNDDYIPDFFGDNINVTAIVGKNGSGKSNILSFFKEQRQEYIQLFLDHDNKLVLYNTSKNICNLVNKTSYIHHDFVIRGNNKLQSDAFLYSLNNKITNPNKYIFMMTYLDVNNLSEIEFGFDIRNVFFNEITRLDYLSKLFEAKKECMNIIKIRDDLGQSSREIDLKFLLHSFQYSFHRHLGKNYHSLKVFLSKYLQIKSIQIELQDIEQIYKYSPYKSSFSSDKFIQNVISEYNEERTGVKKIKLLALLSLYVRNNEIESLVQNKMLDKTNIEIMDFIGGNITSFPEYIQPEIELWILLYNSYESIGTNKEEFYQIYNDLSYKIRQDLFQFIIKPTLSSGQEKLVYIVIELFNYLKINCKGNIIIAIDEGETLLHPKWQKEYLRIIVNLLNNYFPNTKIHLILTTHSPLLLSDIPKQNIIFLDKDDQGNCKVVDGLNDKKQTFGANIHTLLSDSFFMEDGLLGEFAKTKIDKAIAILNQEKLSKEDLEYCEKIIPIIGEPIVKKQLQKMLDSKKLPKVGEIDKIHQEIANLQNRLKVLEADDDEK